MLIILSGSILVYAYYLKEKKEQLDALKRGFCPQCRLDTTELIDKRSEGCSGSSMLTFECSSCGYTNTFSVAAEKGCGAQRRH